jgi:hypothetical protein
MGAGLIRLIEALLLTIGLLFGIAVVVMLALGCGDRASFIIETEEDSLQYPEGPYGFKPAIRAELTSEGDTLPPIWGAEDMFDQDKPGYWVIIVSTKDCAPCDAFYAERDRLVGIIAREMGVIPYVEKQFNPPAEFDDDAWEETYTPRGYPTTFVVDLQTMQIMIEITGFSNRSFFWDEIRNKIKEVKYLTN